ncbi:MAG: flavin reductase family protein [Peptoniphilus sp.]|uniref:flavin reductase family protein n=1 Tax=Peptoniphilus sp. TaxID=1971214 RepID=UPI0025DA3332|nr:flavin reductase family protein [Peptoniphilus sp.]MCI5642615.1 flavin reductase family protein [Peptoniphilus sp.]MDD7352670.1 flavin reductase family protein [Peptoniphilaceae bacterium]
MFYEPKKNNHGLKKNPFKSCTVPRAIGWISTKNPDGTDNIAPYSQFTNLTFDPPLVLFSANQNVFDDRKNTVKNIERTGEFVYNMVSEDLAEAMNKSSIAELPKGFKDKFEYCGLEKVSSEIVDVARVKASPVQYEIKYVQTLRLPGIDKINTIDIIIGEVVGIHIKDRFITEEDKVDVTKIRPVARLGYFDFTVVDNSFTMDTPKIDPAKQALVDKGLEGIAGK